MHFRFDLKNFEWARKLETTYLAENGGMSLCGYTKI